jgi:hypothetical protein
MSRLWVVGILCFLIGGTALHAETAGATNSVTPLEYRRAPDQTFLTFPEWFLVYSPQQYAEYLQKHTPTGFPFVGHLRQFWQSYAAVFHETRSGGYPFNSEYHLMIIVIGASTTFEYTCRSLYESTIGRLTTLTLGNDLTEEDRYASQVAQEYVEFIRVHPWYEFDFWQRLINLWSQSNFFGHHQLRKAERHLALSIEYGGKAVYGKILKAATRSAYAEDSPVTAILINKLPPEVAVKLPELKVLQHFPDDTVLATVPRYQAFTKYASVLAVSGINFYEIAGNRGSILVSVLAPHHWALGDNEVRVLFRQSIFTHPDQERIALVVKVEGLAKLLRQLHQMGIQTEHIYDY